MLSKEKFMPKNYVVKHKVYTFASVFHGIRFKVRRLFVVMTDNFFLHHQLIIPKKTIKDSLSACLRGFFCNFAP